MSKKVGGYENFRVSVEPRRLGDFGSVSVGDWLIASSESELQRLYRQRCDEIADQIKRHVDNIGIVHVEFDTNHVCSHCGSEWTEKSDSYNGGCCEEDQSVEDERLDESKCHGKDCTSFNYSPHSPACILEAAECQGWLDSPEADEARAALKVQP